MTKKARAPIPYYGCKACIGARLAKLFPKHTMFVDVFGGSGAVLLAKEPSKVEVYNDIDSRLVNMYKVIRDNDKYIEMIKLCELQPYSRAEQKEYCRGLHGSDVEQAAQTMFMFCAGMGGRPLPSFPISKATNDVTKKWLARIKRLPEVHERIKCIIIENLDFIKLIKKYDTDDTLFYLDPPYILSTRWGGNKYTYDDYDIHVRLLPLLYNLKSMVIVSGYDGSIYDILHQEYGWDKYAFKVRATSINHPTADSARTEVVWVSPNSKREAAWKRKEK